MSGAEIVFKALEDQKVEYIFGYPGGAVLPIYDELKNHKSIKHILARHEQGAGHAAAGEKFAHGITLSVYLPQTQPRLEQNTANHR